MDGPLWWQFFDKKGIQRADRVIALLEGAKKDLCRCFGVCESKDQVIYPYTRDIFKLGASSKEVAVKYRLPHKHMLYARTLESRKNVANLVRAFSMPRRRTPLEHILVLAGQPGWFYQDIFKTVAELGLTSQVVFLDYVPDEDPPGLHAGADLFAYLSFYEGFGLHVLEAMACGAPVLASNSSSLPEVVGDAGVMLDPTDVDGLRRTCWKSTGMPPCART